MRIGTAKPSLSLMSAPVGFSTLLHIAVIGLLAYRSHAFVAPMLMPGDMHGSQMTLTYLPGRAPRAAVEADSRAPVKPVEATTTAKIVPPLSAKTPVLQHGAVSDARLASASSPNRNSPASVDPNAASGADALGTGNINIAYLDSFRSPRPDLSSLPSGASGEVILDITIDTTGRIVDVKKLSGIGYGVDESVIATVQGWIFHPATKNGTPVVSEQELHFHYERGRNA